MQVPCTSRAFEGIKPGRFLHATDVAFRSTHGDSGEFTIADPEVNRRIRESTPHSASRIGESNDEPVVIQ